MDTMTLDDLGSQLHQYAADVHEVTFTACDCDEMAAAIDAAIRERDELKRELGAFRGVVMQRLDAQKWEQCAERAEAELAALQKRIADAPNMIVVSLPFTIELRADHSSEDAARVSMLDGKRVRLLVEE